MQRVGLALFALLATSSCNALQVTDAGFEYAGDGTRVLFVGNSYLYYNEIPGLVQALADSAKGEKLAVALIAGPDLALWKEPISQRSSSMRSFWKNHRRVCLQP
jgi:hypothetical protein